MFDFFQTEIKGFQRNQTGQRCGGYGSCAEALTFTAADDVRRSHVLIWCGADDVLAVAVQMRECVTSIETLLTAAVAPLTRWAVRGRIGV